MKDKLKPCPFCGGKAVIEKGRSFVGTTYAVKCGNEHDCPMYCLKTKMSHDPKQVIEIWNRRVENER